MHYFEAKLTCCSIISALKEDICVNQGCGNFCNIIKRDNVYKRGSGRPMKLCAEAKELIDKRMMMMMKLHVLQKNYTYYAK